MNIESILKTNSGISKDIEHLERKKEVLSKQINHLMYTLIPPCEYCKYDGEFRCMVCRENCFDGYNIKEYP
jgi:hypothetical protein